MKVLLVAGFLAGGALFAGRVPIVLKTSWVAYPLRILQRMGSSSLLSFSSWPASLDGIDGGWQTASLAYFYLSP